VFVDGHPRIMPCYADTCSGKLSPKLPPNDADSRALTGLDGLGALVPRMPVDAVESLSGRGIPAR
jgi:hypothetical protein